LTKVIPSGLRLLFFAALALVLAAGAIAAEPVDARAYAAIRAEGVLERRRAADYAGELADGIGARLTGSPNFRRAAEWAVDTLHGLGAADAHLEDFGEFGIGWRQANAWMRMAYPDAMVFVAQAAPWSVATPGPVEGEAVAVEISSDADFASYRGKLAGRIVLLGQLRLVPSPVEPFSKRFSDAELASGAAEAQIRRYYETRSQHLADMARRNAFRVRLAHFLESERVLAVVLPSADGADAGGTGDLTADGSSAPGGRAWVPAERAHFPIAYTAIEDFGRVRRLLDRREHPRIQLELDTEDLGERAHGFNVVADIPGSDPMLKKQIVLVGAHLDSWAAGTGATDDAAGVAITLEAIRILQGAGLKPRRTIRVVLYGGEEEGLFGSAAYARRHLGVVPRSVEPDQLLLAPESWRKPVGPLRTEADYPNLSAAYNMDDGGGRIRSVFTGGNPALAEIFRAWIAPLKDLGVASVADSPDWPADESTYTEIGLPGITFLQDPLDYGSRSHHTNMDTVERLQPADLAQAATVEAVFLINTANRDDLLPRPHQPREGAW
jgi:carboxypeptidase Q